MKVHFSVLIVIPTNQINENIYINNSDFPVNRRVCPRTA
ncbi:hypothetical protein WPG_2091 [Winogradskyella sp. PG-2]|nr:hypothetical protein WPG_2091 [Winogradskyella sp. PG-2]